MTSERSLIDTALSTAAVGAVFGLIGLGLLIHAGLRLYGTVPAQESRLAAMRADLKTENEPLVRDIRAMDLEIRAGRMRWTDRLAKAAGLLLAGAIVFVAGLKWWTSLTWSVSRPSRPDVRAAAGQVRLARMGVGAVGLGLAVACAWMVTRPAISLATPESKGPASVSAEQWARQWPRFRGPGGGGVIQDSNVPTEWDAAAGRGILWKTPVPLPGNNSPIVWEDRVFLSGGQPNRLEVYAFDARSGKILWTGEVPYSATEELQIGEDTGLAAGTLATDGQRVYAIFATGDLACFDFSGRRIWHRALGVPDSTYGYASSLEVFGQMVLVQFDQAEAQDNKSKVMAFDGPTGRPAWSTPRPVPASWTSPVVVRTATGPQLITVGNPWVISYDPGTGQELWRAKVVAGDVAPSAILAGDLVVAIEPYSKAVGIRTDGRADVTAAWECTDSGPDICSPVSDGTHVYLLSTDGLLTCVKAIDGSSVYEQDLKGAFYASPSLVGDKLYLLNDKGVMIIASAGPQFKELGRSALAESCQASPAFAQGRIYVRTQGHLVCIGGGDKP